MILMTREDKERCSKFPPTQHYWDNDVWIADPGDEVLFYFKDYGCNFEARGVHLPYPRKDYEKRRIIKDVNNKLVIIPAACYRINNPAGGWYKATIKQFGGGAELINDKTLDLLTPLEAVKMKTKADKRRAFVKKG